MQEDHRNKGKEHYSQGITAISRIQTLENQKITLTSVESTQITEDFERISQQVQQLDHSIRQQVEVVYNNFQDAMKYFTLGKNEASRSGNGQEWVYCTRNYGITALKLASLIQFQQYYPQLKVIYYFKEAIQYLIEGNINGQRCHLPSSWLERSSNDLYEVMEELKSYILIKTTNYSERCGLFESFKQVASNHPRVLTHLYLSLSQECVKVIVKLDENNDNQEDDNQTYTTSYSDIDWKTPKNALCDLSMYLNFARSSITSIDERDPYLERFNHKLEDINDSYQVYQLRIDSSQLITNALSTQYILLYNDADFYTDLVWDVVDQLRAARRIAECGTNPSIELQAKSIALLGIFYTQVLKINIIGRKLCRNGIELITALHDGRVPAILNSDWYQKAKLILQSVNHTVPSSNDPNLPVDDIKKELATELNAIQTAINQAQGKSYKAYHFLKHIYQFHPPKNGDILTEEIDKDNDAQLKKCMIFKVLFPYSPDKEWNFWTANDHESKKWYVLCGEIVRIGGDFHQYFKGFG